jgi:hypothetical protein
MDGMHGGGGGEEEREGGAIRKGARKSVGGR